MICIYCNADTKVTNSRHQKRANAVWRRRQCISCTTIFSTIEAADTSLSISVNHSGSLEPFQRDKLFLSVYESLKHRKSAQMDATGLTNTMLASIYSLSNDAQIDCEAIITITSSILERFDKVAATHYQAFHPLNKD